MPPILVVLLQLRIIPSPIFVTYFIQVDGCSSSYSYKSQQFILVFVPLLLYTYNILYLRWFLFIPFFMRYFTYHNMLHILSNMNTLFGFVVIFPLRCQSLTNIPNFFILHFDTCIFLHNGRALLDQFKVVQSKDVQQSYIRFFLQTLVPFIFFSR